MPWIADLINSAKTIAIVGISDKPDRPSYMVAKHLIDSGDYEIYLVHPMYKEIFGKKVYEKLEDIPELENKLKQLRESKDQIIETKENIIKRLTK